MMRRVHVLTCAMFVASAALIGPTALDAQVPRNRPLYPGEQWVQLFNGKDLTNWVQVGKERWTIEDGVGRRSATPGPT